MRELGRWWRDRNVAAAAWQRSPLAIDHNRWQQARAALAEKHGGLFSDVDAVVVNAEGTLHHNFPGALSICALVWLAKQHGCRVALVNGSLQQMDRRVLKETLHCCECIAVREPRSLAWLRSLGYRATLSADCLFGLHVPPTDRTPEPATCLYTPGVLGIWEEHVNRRVIREHLRQLRRAGYRVTFLTMTAGDVKFHGVAATEGCAVVAIGEVTYQRLCDLIRLHELVVSGRYHLNIFAWLAGCPVIPMQSNTWKVEGLLELVGCHRAPVRTPESLRRWIGSGGVTVSQGRLEELRKLSTHNTPVFESGKTFEAA